MTAPTKVVPTLYLTLDEAATAVGVSADLLVGAVKIGTLRAKRTGPNGGGRYLFRVSDLEEWYEGLEDA